MKETYTRRLKRTVPPKKKVVQSLLKNPLLAQREIHNRSFYKFLLFMWPVVSSEPLQINWHMKYICEQLQELAETVAAQKDITGSQKKAIEDLLINVPPGTSKTTITMIMFPAWCWTRWYWMEFITLSYAATLSLESAEACRELIRSERYQAVYPDLSIKKDKDQKSNYQVLKTLEKKPGYPASTRQGGSRFSTSVGGSLTGFHGHIILVDDPINPEQAVSPVQLETANRWMDSTLPTRKIHKNSSPMVMIMQRLHENDPTGHHLDKKKDRTSHICLPGEIRNYEEKVRPAHLKEKYVDDLLDPERMGWGALEDLEADLGQYGYAGQVGQSPTPPEGGMFKIDKLQVIDKRPLSEDIEQIVRYWDKAGTESKTGSKTKGPAWSVGVKMAKLKSGKFVILNVVRGRWSSEVRETYIKQTTEMDGRNVVVGIEQEPGSGGKESAESTIKNLSGYRVVAERPTGDKVYRADPFSVQVNYGNVMMMQADWNSDYSKELKYFPYSTFKDQVDASSGAFNLLNKRKKASVW